MSKKKIIGISILVLISIVLALFLFLKKINHVNETDFKEEDKEMEVIDVKKVQLEANGGLFDIELEDNSSAKAFVEKLKEGELSIYASDYGNFEKVGSLGFDLPTNDQRFTTEPGDLILYQGNQITLYYDTNTWNFTKLGKIKNVNETELREVLGEGDVILIFSL